MEVTEAHSKFLDAGTEEFPLWDLAPEWTTLETIGDSVLVHPEIEPQLLRRVLLELIEGGFVEIYEVGPGVPNRKLTLGEGKRVVQNEMNWISPTETGSGSWYEDVTTDAGNELYVQTKDTLGADAQAEREARKRARRRKRKRR